MSVALFRETYGLTSPQSVPTGILHIEPLTFYSVDQYNGCNHYDTLSQRNWEQQYYSLYNSLLEDSVITESLPDLHKIKDLAESYTKEGVTPIVIASLKFNQPTSRVFKEFIANSKETIRKYKVANSDGAFNQPQPILREKQVFLASVLLPDIYDVFHLLPPMHKGSTVTYVTDRIFYISNLGEPSSIEIDFADGQGLQKIDFGQMITIHYPDIGEKRIKVRVHYRQQILTSFFTISLGNQCDAPSPDIKWTVSSTIPYLSWFQNDGEINSYKTTYQDLDPVQCPKGQVVIGFAFYPKRNRLAPKLLCANPDGSNSQWVQNDNWDDHNYLTTTYQDLGLVQCPAGQMVIGFAFYQKANRLAPKLLCANPDGSNSQWVQNNDMGDYRELASQDLGEVICQPGKFIEGVSFYRKRDRIAPQVLTLINLTRDIYTLYGNDKGGKHTNLVKPLLIADGFPGNSYEEIYSRFGNLIDGFLKAGFDVVIYPYGTNQGKSYIQQYALLSIAVIQKIIQERSGSEMLIACGASMGGLVLRYGLAYMERYSLDHQVQKFISFDSPQQGANIPVSVQASVEILAPYSASASDNYELVGCIAARQMLYFQWEYNSYRSYKASFRRELADLGQYPKKTKNIAISCGSFTGELFIPSGDIVVDWSGNMLENGTARSLTTEASPETIAEYTLGLKTYTYSWTNLPGADFDGASGGLRSSFEDLAKGLEDTHKGTVENPWKDHCFVPTVSALDIVGKDYEPLTEIDPSGGSRSAFDQYYVSPQNYDHLDATPQIIAFLMNELTGNSIPSSQDIINQSWPGNYLSLQYQDLGGVQCPSGKVVIGFAFYQKGNRLAPKIYCANPDGSDAQWITNDDWADYSNLEYQDLGIVRSTLTNTAVTAFSFCQKINRLAPKVTCQNIP